MKSDVFQKYKDIFTPALKCSICRGEQVAGSGNK